MLTGAHPFKGRNFNELKSKLKSGDYKIPRNISVSFDCMHFLNQCLRYDQKRRPDYHGLLEHLFILKIDSTNYLDVMQAYSPLPSKKHAHCNIPSVQKSIELNVRQSVDMAGAYQRMLMDE